jgi:hypothetical protein
MMFPNHQVVDLAGVDAHTVAGVACADVPAERVARRVIAAVGLDVDAVRGVGLRRVAVHGAILRAGG